MSETIAWFAWHRHDGRDAVLFDDERRAADGRRIHLRGASWGPSMTDDSCAKLDRARLSGAGTASAPPQGTRIRHRRRVGRLRARLLCAGTAFTATSCISLPALVIWPGAMSINRPWFRSSPGWAPTTIRNLVASVPGVSGTGRWRHRGRYGPDGTVNSAAAGRHRQWRRSPRPRPRRSSARFICVSDHLFDMFFWSAITLLVVRLLRTGDERLWVVGRRRYRRRPAEQVQRRVPARRPGGGPALGGRRRALRSVWLWAGAGLALAIWSPNLIWNAQHDWAAVAMMRSLHEENSTLEQSIGFIPSQFFVVGPVLIVSVARRPAALLGHPFARPLG